MKVVLFLSVLLIIAAVDAKKEKKVKEEKDRSRIGFEDGHCVVDRVAIEVGSTWLSAKPCARFTCTESGYNSVNCALVQLPPNTTCVPSSNDGVYPACCQTKKCTLADGSVVFA